jgi:hypothetical protein
MIGWIALAGIIVRNSILLVDFAIHEIQKGVPVAEAMIRSCKIRTRPIVITALALVAGSSVIITDPIFQGMAISLLSGVLVSTVLTLIVIPLGCVAAGDDMCRVALATAPPGTSLPCMTDAEPRNAPRKSSGGGVSRFFGKVVEFFILALYAVRGIFILLFDAAKTALKSKPTRPARSPVERSAVKRAPAETSSEEDAPSAKGDSAASEPARTVSKTKRATTASDAKPAARKTAAKKTEATEKSSQAVQKRAPRRGIRLKIDDESDT